MRVRGGGGSRQTLTHTCTPRPSASLAARQIEHATSEVKGTLSCLLQSGRTAPQNVHFTAIAAGVITTEFRIVIVALE